MIRAAHPAVAPCEPGSTQHPRGPSHTVARMAVEFGLPVAVYYALRVASVDTFSALSMG